MSLLLHGDQKAVYGLIWPRTSANPVSIAEIREKTGLSPRTIKGIVEDLRIDHRLPIGASRRPPFGYFWCVSAADIDASVLTMVSQAKRMLQAASRLAGKQRVREMLGQERLI